MRTPTWDGPSLRTCVGLIMGFLCLVSHDACAGDTAPGDAVDRGRIAVRTVTNPLAATFAAYDRIWSQWGLGERPDTFAEMVRERYGMQEAPYDNAGLPMGLRRTDGPIGTTIGHDCLLCHAGRIAGQTILGLGNASIDLQLFYTDLTKQDIVPIRVPYQLSNGRGVIEAVAGIAYLMQFRDAELNLRAPVPLTMDDQLCEDIPAWWNMRKKRTMFHTGGTDVRAVRPGMAFLLAPTNTADVVKAEEDRFRDIKAYLMSLEPPKYPFPIDRALAETGRSVFEETCSRCHGRYGPDAEYPNRIVPLDEIGTDSRLALHEVPADEQAYYQSSWLFRETGPDGRRYNERVIGYQAPPLDGVWATAPYLHNGSIATIYEVLKSTARAKYFTRSFRTDRDAYDADRVGWKIQRLANDPDTAEPPLAPVERHKITDTTEPGRGNGGHTFGDDLTEAERSAVIEYLKTL